MMVASRMTVEEAIRALQENAECFSYDVPPKIFEQRVEDTAIALMFSRSSEDYQHRTNEAWSKLMQEEDDPLEAASWCWIGLTIRRRPERDSGAMRKKRACR